MKQLLLLCLFMMFFSCKTEKKTNQGIESAKKEQSNEPLKKDIFDESDFVAFDVSNFQSGNLLIGNRNSLSENNVAELNIIGYNAYEFNTTGLITKKVNITNDFSEFFYNKEGNLSKVLLRQHNPKLTYFERVYHYSGKDLIEVVETKFNNKSEVEKREVITNSTELKKMNKPLFKRALGLSKYKIDTTNRIIMTYRSDLVFCCGEKMDGNNRLLYYYNQNDLIDSLVIKKVGFNKKMKFVYDYQLR